MYNFFLNLKKYSVLIVTIIFIGSFNSCKNPNGSMLTISGKEDFADSAISKVKLGKDNKGREVLQKDNTVYDIVDFIDKRDTKKIILKITKSETSYVDSDASKIHFIVSAIGVNDKSINWRKEFNAADIDYTYKVVIVHTEGKGQDQEDTYAQYSLLTGEKLMTYTYGQLMTLIPGTSNKRFVGYLSKESATEEKPEGFAMISYVGSREIIDQIKVNLKGNNTSIPVYTPELKMLVASESGNTLTNDGKSVIMGHASRMYTNADMNNFAVQINYLLPGAIEPITILLPIREDRLDLENASYDKKIFELSRTSK